MNSSRINPAPLFVQRWCGVKNVVILATELAAVFLMVFGVLPRETSLVLTGIMLFYFIFSPLEDSLWVFIASVPLFVALPVTENFDSMANWRILLSVLFLVWFFKYGISIKLGVGKLKEKFKHWQWEYLVVIFVLIGILSLLAVDSLVLGIKKILFLVNIFLLYLIIKNLGKEIVPKLLNAVKVAIGITLGVGFLQLIMVFFINLHQFWYLWDMNVINVFYGQNLSDLLSYSNTWFSYYTYQLPTLRMFSVFPDSHSFAFFCILALPFFLAAVLKKKNHRFIWYSLLILCLLAIIFSGSRGAWASALGVLILSLIAIFFFPKRRKELQIVLGSLIIFFLLMPIASTILFLPQYIQLGDISDVALFERARSIIDLSELSVKSRLDIWRRTLDSMVIHPLLGVGIGNFPRVLNEGMSATKRGASAHSLYLDVAAEMGIFALLVLLFVFWRIFKDSWRFFLRENGFFVLALVWILGYSIFDVVLLNDKVFLFFVTNLALFYAAEISSSFN